MDLECPYPGGVQHFRPPCCPRPECRSRAPEGPTFRYSARGRFHRKCDRRTVRRFHCHVCRRSFSVQTFRVDFNLKRPHLTVPIFDLFVSKVTQRQAARILICNRKTVRRRLLLFELHSRQFQTAVLERARMRGNFGGRFQLDEQETFETDRKVQPVTMPVLIHQDSRFVLHVEPAALPARGKLTRRELERKKRYESRHGVRKSGSREAVKRCFAVLAHARGPDLLEIITDRKPSYRTVLAETMPGRYVHTRHSGRAPRTTANPLWPINHTLKMLRDGLSRLVRKNWGVSKERAWLGRHAWIWIAYRNYIRPFTNKKARTTSAQQAGLVSRTFTKTKFLEWRVVGTS